MCARTHTDTHKHAHTRTYAHTRTDTDTHTQTRPEALRQDGPWQAEAISAAPCVVFCVCSKIQRMTCRSACDVCSVAQAVCHPEPCPPVTWAGCSDAVSPTEGDVQLLFKKKMGRYTPSRPQPPLWMENTNTHCFCYVCIITRVMFLSLYPLSLSPFTMHSSHPASSYSFTHKSIRPPCVSLPLHASNISERAASSKP